MGQKVEGKVGNILKCTGKDDLGLLSSRGPKSLKPGHGWFHYSEGQNGRVGEMILETGTCESQD